MYQGHTRCQLASEPGPICELEFGPKFPNVLVQIWKVTRVSLALKRSQNADQTDQIEMTCMCFMSYL